MFELIPRLCRVFLFLVLATIVAASPAFAQGGSTSTIAGTVTDTSGAVVPGADIVVKSVTTGTVYNAVSGSDGSFTIPAVPPGTYSVTVTLMGFKTAVLNDVVANVAQVANVKAVLTPRRPRRDRRGVGRDRDHPDPGHVRGRDAGHEADREPAGRRAAEPSNWWATCPAWRPPPAASAMAR